MSNFCTCEKPEPCECPQFKGLHCKRHECGLPIKPKEERASYCPHGRPVGQICPHCSGINTPPTSEAVSDLEKEVIKELIAPGAVTTTTEKKLVGIDGKFYPDPAFDSERWNIPTPEAPSEKWEVEFDQLLSVFNINRRKPTREEVEVESAVKSFISSLLTTARAEERAKKAEYRQSFMDGAKEERERIEKIVEGERREELLITDANYYEEQKWEAQAVNKTLQVLLNILRP